MPPKKSSNFLSQMVAHFETRKIEFDRYVPHAHDADARGLHVHVLHDHGHGYDHDHKRYDHALLPLKNGGQYLI